MAQTAGNTTAAAPVITGGILVALKGTALPTDATTALNAAFKALGYVGRDGLTPAGSAPSFEQARAWGGDLIDSLITEKGTTEFTFDLLEVMNPDVAKTVFGDSNVTVTPATASAGTKVAILDKQHVIPRMAVAFDMKYGSKAIRIIGGNVQLVKEEEGAYTDTALSYYRMRAQFFPDSTGVTSYRYLLNDDKTA